VCRDEIRPSIRRRRRTAISGSLNGPREAERELDGFVDRERLALRPGAGSGTGTCKVTMTAAEAVTATFRQGVASSSHSSLPVGAIRRSFSKKVKKGRVISQKPKPHTRLAHGAKVNLVVSKGKHR
jgi:PASTA domain-containing protein